MNRFALTIFLFLLFLNTAHALEGRVIDEKTQAPISNATVRNGNEEALTDEKGQFRFATTSEKNALNVRAIGYLRNTTKLNSDTETQTIALTPFQPKAIYLSAYGIGNKPLRDNALRLLKETELNALVIDIKGDRGFLPYPSKIAEAHNIGAQKVITVRDMPALIAELHAQNIYLIARIVTFKDHLLSTAYPKFAVRDARGQVWQDREKLRWVDPSIPEVWQYNIDIAAEAAQMGFDEIQFDYVRFPDAKGLQFAKKNTEKFRVETITGFLQAAKKRLAEYNVFVSADVFGYVCWNINDTDIGQQLDKVTAVLDYVSPMLYPSGFSFGIPGLRDPLSDTHALILRSLQNAQRRTGASGMHYRPWLQAFRDYAFDRRTFGADEIRAQIDAAEESGSNGWMLWNASNNYSKAGLKP